LQVTPAVDEAAKAEEKKKEEEKEREEREKEEKEKAARAGPLPLSPEASVYAAFYSRSSALCAIPNHRLAARSLVVLSMTR